MSVTQRSSAFPIWIMLSLSMNCLLFLAVVILILKERRILFEPQANAAIQASDVALSIPVSGKPAPQLGPRHQLNYDQWLDLLQQEADASTPQNSNHLSILLGDSICLWFPNELLPPGQNWLNQGVSGETSTGLLKRLEILDKTRPANIFVMIGINDLIQGYRDETILANYREIVDYLQQQHPQAQIVVQSILPHAAEQATWEGRDRLLEIPNDRIVSLNQQIQTIATDAGVHYLDLSPLFSDDQGRLQGNFTTDGLHLSPQGYRIWRAALQVHDQLVTEAVGISASR